MREIIKSVLDGQKPPYVPWSFGFTLEARQRLMQHFRTEDMEPILQNHLLDLGHGVGFFTDLGNHQVQDVFGVVWDRSVD